MRYKSIDYFVISAALLLLITAAAKFVSALGDARILTTRDPVLGMSYRTIFWLVGGTEFAVSLFCFFGKNLLFRAGLVAWLATSVLLYRLGLSWIDFHKPCPCLGNLTDALHIPPQTAETAMKIILAYLLIGSYASLFWLWRQRKTTAITLQPNYQK